jgi:hypothetical protein
LKSESLTAEQKCSVGLKWRAMTFNAIRYRAYFEDARKRAEQVSDPLEKQAWQRMAEKWLKLLVLAEQRTPTEA